MPSNKKIIIWKNELEMNSGKRPSENFIRKNVRLLFFTGGGELSGYDNQFLMI